MKETIEKYKQESIGYETKMEAMKKEYQQSQGNYRKQVMALEKELEHQKQRLNLEKTKNNDLQEKISAKNQLFKK